MHADTSRDYSLVCPSSIVVGCDMHGAPWLCASIARNLPKSGWVEGEGGKPEAGYTFQLECLEKL